MFKYIIPILFIVLSTILINNHIYAKSKIYIPPNVHKVYNIEEIKSTIKCHENSINSTLTNNVNNNDNVESIENGNSVFEKAKREFKLKKRESVDNIDDDDTQRREKFKQIAINYLVKEIGITADELDAKDTLLDTEMANVHFVQKYNGIEISDLQAGVNIDRETGLIISYSSNFVPINGNNTDISVKEDNTKDIGFKMSVELLLKHVNEDDIEDDLVVDEKASYDNDKNCRYVRGVKKATDNYVVVCKKLTFINENTLETIYEVLAGIEYRHSYVAEISATSGEILDIKDLVFYGTYNAIPWYKEDIRGGRELIVNPENRNASPKDWHRDGTNKYYYTNGNNVEVLSFNTDITISHVPSSKKKSFIFDHYYNETAVYAKENYKASATNVFYMCNILHDFYHTYGFNEEYGSFQANRWGKSSIGEDKLLVLTNTHSENGSFFTIKPHGKGRSHINLVEIDIGTLGNTSERDDGFANSVIAHEYTHGVSNRLVGGLYRTKCLLGFESAGLGEGYSDFFAMLLIVRKGDDRSKVIKLGEWTYGELRRHPYSTDMSINPIKYSDLTVYENDPVYVHFVGFVWASMLYEVFWNIAEEYGISNNVILNPRNKDDYYYDLEKDSTILPGNVRMAKILIDSWKRLPCDGTLLNARDAILSAQKEFSNFKRMRCAIWRGFAKRGLGTGAKPFSYEHDYFVNYYKYENNYDIPSDC